MHTNVNVLADQRSLSILTVNLSFIARAGAGRQKQCVVLSVCASLWRNRHAYCFALCTVSVTHMHSRFCSLAQHACLLFRSPYCQCHTHALLVLLPRATHMLFRSLYCQCHTHASLVLMPRATHMLTVLFSVPSESRTCLIGSTVYSNTHACCYALCTVRVSGATQMLTVSALCCQRQIYVHSWFCCLAHHTCLLFPLSVLSVSHAFIVGSACLAQRPCLLFHSLYC